MTSIAPAMLRDGGRRTYGTPSDRVFSGMTRGQAPRPIGALPDSILSGSKSSIGTRDTIRHTNGTVSHIIVAAVTDKKDYEHIDQEVLHFRQPLASDANMEIFNVLRKHAGFSDTLQALEEEGKRRGPSYRENARVHNPLMKSLPAVNYYLRSPEGRKRFGTQCNVMGLQSLFTLMGIQATELTDDQKHATHCVLRVIVAGLQLMRNYAAMVGKPITPGDKIWLLCVRCHWNGTIEEKERRRRDRNKMWADSRGAAFAAMRERDDAAEKLREVRVALTRRATSSEDSKTPVAGASRKRRTAEGDDPPSRARARASEPPSAVEAIARTLEISFLPVGYAPTTQLSAGELADLPDSGLDAYLRDHPDLKPRSGEAGEEVLTTRPVGSSEENKLIDALDQAGFVLPRNYNDLVRADGNCFPDSLADQLVVMLADRAPRDWENNRGLRIATSNRVRERLVTELRRGAAYYTRKYAGGYTAENIRPDGAYCDLGTLAAAANAYAVNIIVHTSFGTHTQVFPLSDGAKTIADRRRHTLNIGYATGGRFIGHFYSPRAAPAGPRRSVAAAGAPAAPPGGGVARSEGASAGAPIPPESSVPAPARRLGAESTIEDLRGVLSGSASFRSAAPAAAAAPRPPTAPGERPRSTFRTSAAASDGSAPRDPNAAKIQAIHAMLDDSEGISTRTSDKSYYWQYLFWTGAFAPPLDLYNGTDWAGSCSYIGIVQDRSGAMTNNLKRASIEAMRALCPTDNTDDWKDLALTGWLTPSIAH